MSGTLAVPVAIEISPQGDIFICQKAGRVIVHSGGIKQATPFIDLVDEVNNNGDRGLLGIALYPGFVPDGGETSWVYLVYTVSPVPGVDWGVNQDQKFGFSRVTRYKAITSPQGEILADPATRQIIVGQPLNEDGTNVDGIPSIRAVHGIGTIRFGNDGTLLIGSGETADDASLDAGGFDNAAFDDFIHPVTGKKGPYPKYEDSGAFRSRDIRSLAGKILRVDPVTGQGLPSNPFYNGDPDSNQSKVFALGFRNPFRFSVRPGSGSTDPSDGTPGAVYIGDVGWVQWEELNVAFGGEDFMWPCTEGRSAAPRYAGQNYREYVRGPDPLGRPDCGTPSAGVLTRPILAYTHCCPEAFWPANSYVDDNNVPIPAGYEGNSITAGRHYLGGSYPQNYVGRFFFADYDSDWIKVVETDANDNVLYIRDFATNAGGVVDFARHPVTGDIYYVSINRQKVYRIRYGTNQTPVAVASSNVYYGALPLTVQFSSAGSYDPDQGAISFKWSFGDNTPDSNQPNPTHTYTAAGAYQVKLTVTDGEGLFSESLLTIYAGNTPPTVQITSPQFNHLFADVEDLALTALVSDAEDGPGQLSYQWTADLYHNDHVHYSAFNSTAPSPTMHVEPHGDAGEVYYYRLELKVTDTQGLSVTDHIYMYALPQVLDYTLTAIPIAKVLEMDPPGPIGSGNPLIQVIKDGIYPEGLLQVSQAQYSTRHTTDKDEFDWIGYQLPQVLGPEARFIEIEFMEGLVSPNGGWFDTLQVEVRENGIWKPVQSLRVSPQYQGGANPSFSRFTLKFDPIFGDAIRLAGKPGGVQEYISAAEIRFKMVYGANPVSDASTVGSTRGHSDGAWVSIGEPLSVTLSPLVETGYFYAQNQAGIAGIRVESAGPPPAIGTGVRLRGQLATNLNGERVLKDAEISFQGLLDSPVRKTANKWLGGVGYVDEWGVSPMSLNLINEGLLLKTSGRISEVHPGYIIIDDGSLVWYGQEQRGLKVTNVPTVGLSVGQYVTVTGVVVPEMSDGMKRRTIKGRNGLIPGDIELQIP